MEMVRSFEVMLGRTLKHAVYLVGSLFNDAFSVTRLGYVVSIIR
jgi:hypothetical protein